MYAMKEEDCFQSLHNIQEYQDQFLHHHQQHQQIFPWSLHTFDQTRNPDPVPPSPYGNFFNRREPSSLHDGFGTGSTHPSMDYNQQSHLRILSEALGPMIGPILGLDPFGLEAEMGKMSAQEIMDAKALAASKSHSEAERRRRERINNHLAKLRSILPSTTKTDKASLLAEVIQHVKELKRQTSLIYEACPVPTETDELTVDVSAEDHDGNFVIKVTICCQDRPDLMADVIRAIKALRLRTLKAEITTLGGRVKNILFITREEYSRSNCDYNDNNGRDEEKIYCVSSVQEALKAVMQKSDSGDNLDQSSSGNIKRQRTNNSNH